MLMKEVIYLSKSALIVVDMVYDFTNENGLVYYPQNREVLPKIQQAIDICRDNDALIVFMQHRYRKGKMDKNLVNMRPSCIEGSGGEEIDESLTVLEQDYVIPKRRYSSFYGTDLDLVLREHDIKNVIIVGTKTNCCIRATVSDAHHLDYNVFVIKECVATNDEVVNEIYLRDFDKYFGSVVSLDDLQTLYDEKEI